MNLNTAIEAVCEAAADIKAVMYIVSSKPFLQGHKPTLTRKGEEQYVGGILASERVFRHAQLVDGNYQLGCIGIVLPESERYVQIELSKKERYLSAKKHGTSN